MSKTPNIRFNGFSDNWKEKQLSEIFVIKNNKNKNQYSRDGVLSVSDYEGCVNQIKFHGRSFAGKDISNYKIADIGDIIYTKSPLQSKPYGIVKIVTEEAGIVSPLYVVNVPTKENDSFFMYYLFDSPERTNKYLEPLVRKGAKNTMNISDGEWLSGNIVVTENLEEQQKIGLLFKKIDDLINIESSKIDELSKIKQSLLLKMFPAENKDIPCIRFKDFTDTWEQRKLGEMGKARSGTGFPDIEQGGTSGIPFFKVSDMNSKDNQSEMIIANNYVTPSQILNNKWIPIEEVPAIFFAKVGAAVMLNRKRLCRSPFLLDNNTMAYSLSTEKWDTNFAKTLFDSIDLTTLVQVGAFPSYNAGDVEGIETYVPNINEQQKIGSLFENLDNLITLHQCKPFHLNFSL